MSRAIVFASVEEEGSRSGGDSTPSDQYTDKLLKLIPAEVVAGYLAMVNAIPAPEGPVNIIGTTQGDRNAMLALWFCLGFGMVLTYLYTRTSLKIAGAIHRLHKRQLYVTVGAFFVWALTIGGPFEHYPWYESYYGAIILPAYTLLVPYMIED